MTKATLQELQYRTDVAALAKFYGVSTDYLFGVTDNRQHRNVEVDALALSETLKSKKLNNRLISELLSHPDFQQLLSAMEVYIDKKLLPHMNTMNAVYKLAETTIKEIFTVQDNDEERQVLTKVLRTSVVVKRGFRKK